MITISNKIATRIYISSLPLKIQLEDKCVDRKITPPRAVPREWFLAGQAILSKMFLRRLDISLEILIRQTMQTQVAEVAMP